MTHHAIQSSGIIDDKHKELHTLINCEGVKTQIDMLIEWDKTVASKPKLSYNKIQFNLHTLVE